MEIILSTTGIDLTNAVWLDTVGRIFLLSIAYYLFSSFVISGYISFFAGGFSHIGFGEFSLVDFLFFFPMIFITGISMVFDNLWRAALSFLLNFILPILAGLYVTFWIINSVNAKSFPEFILTATFMWGSIIIWSIGFNFWIRNIYKKWIPFFLQFLGTLCFGISVSGMSIAGLMPAPISINPVAVFTLNLFTTILLIISLLASALIVGNTIAREAVKNKFLSQITRLELSEPITGLERWKTRNQEKPNNNIFHIFFSRQARSTSYQYEPNEDAILVASFSKMSAIYTYNSSAAKDENGKLILLSNHIISSLEIKSGKLKYPSGG